ncbi:MAG: hypothetical protein HQK49_19275 [Oligoflexia bacterium]|nr:hypothetical protein [Oligoflexia bacterium]
MKSKSELKSKFGYSKESVLLLCCFVLSGFSALIYEVAWLQRVQLVMGFTVYAMVTLLCAYLCGLGLGALFTPKILNVIKLPSIFLYFVVEMLVGIYGMFFDSLLKILDHPFNSIVLKFSLNIFSISLLQFIFFGVLILIPTFLMGMTLPLLSDYFLNCKKGDHGDGRGDGDYNYNYNYNVKVSTLYAFNTLGAFLGSIVSGFFIIPALGYSKAMLVAASINFILVIIGVSFSEISIFEWKVEKVEKVGKVEKVKRFKNFKFSLADLISGISKREWMIFVILMLIGIVSMFAQIILNRMSSVVFGGSVYIFPIVTALVLLGIVIGGFIISSMNSKIDSKKNILIFAPLAAAIFFSIGTYLLSCMPTMVLWWHQRLVPKFVLYSLLQFTHLLIIFLPSLILMGLIFPFAIDLLVSSNEMTIAKRRIKLISFGYASNIVGLIFGSLIGAFVILANWGVEFLAQTTYVLLIAISLFAYFLLLASATANLSRQVMLFIPLVLLAITSFYIIPPFDYELYSSGHFYNRKAVRTSEELVNMGLVDLRSYSNFNYNKILEYKDDPFAFISVHRSVSIPSHRIFKVNGKIDGGNNVGDIRTTKLVVLLPHILTNKFENIVTIGLGIGVTFAETLNYPELKSSTIVEISKEMLNFSQKYFYEHNYRIWFDPRVHIENRDGREFLKHTNKKFDLIINEPSNPWINGVAGLFTVDFFRLLSSKLTSNGVASLWFHSYGLDCLAVVSVFKAVAEVFPTFLIFKKSGDYFILAKNQKTPFTFKSQLTKSQSTFSSTLPKTSIPEVELSKELSQQEKELISYMGDIKSTQVTKDKTVERGLLYSSIFNRNLIADQLAIKNIPGVVNSDDNQYLQYFSGRTFWTGTGCETIDLMIDYNIVRDRYVHSLLK